jgi:hypothetical protein
MRKMMVWPASAVKRCGKITIAVLSRWRHALGFFRERNGRSAILQNAQYRHPT